MKRFAYGSAAIVTAALALVTVQGQAGGAKGSPWKPILSAEVYKELRERSVKVIEEAARAADKDAAEKISVEAAILVGYTLSVKNPEDAAVASMRGAALQAAKAMQKKDFKGLAEFGKLSQTAAKAPAQVMNWQGDVADLLEVMNLFRGKAKRGEGTHPDLHYQPKLKNLNGSEALIGALASKKLSDANAAKVAKELPLLAFRVAVVGSMTHEYARAKDTAVGKWRELSVQMRDASVSLATAAHKKDVDGIMQAALTLENSCTACHRDFRGK